MEDYRCEKCGQPGISDRDGDWLCQNCQDNADEAAYDRQQEALMEGGGGPSLIEQQRAAYKIKRGLR
jgi:uncharacterized Zn finger protein (UPF0148 family)